ncbi:MAG TPA: hypothetical protein PLL80_00440 [Candidatus Pacearchaeota archaeon]|nr:hypothetical protein [Candidatus Pacearchaeota archaeon]HOK93998.1 hypothetical protein [Candidatus Pacearchaeota archaeon]HPO75069.1 hypothetical protein [Candidatus Pacearchaeota archaeon]
MVDGNKGYPCCFKDAICQEAWCDECQIYYDWKEASLFFLEKAIREIYEEEVNNLKPERGNKNVEIEY